MLHFIDKFLLDETLSDFELNSSDYNEISIGILIGSLDKIDNISPDFIKSLKQNKNLDSSFKAIFLIKVLKHLQKSLFMLNEKDKLGQANKINEMNQSSEVLLEILGEVQIYKHELIQNYRDLFDSYLNQFSINDKIITLAIYAYPLKAFLPLECSFFFLNQNELKDISNSPSSDDYFELTKLLLKGCQIVSEKRIPCKDVLSITIFNKLLEFLNVSLEENRNINYNEVINKLLKFKSNFSPRQIYRFRDFYNRIIIKKIALKNQEFENVFEQDPNSRSQPFTINKLNASSYPNKFGISRPNIPPQDNRRERIYNGDIEEEFEKEPDHRKNQEVEDSLSVLFENFNGCDPTTIDLNFLIGFLNEYVQVSPKAVNYHLCKRFTYQRDTAYEMIEIWKIIVEALKQIKDYPETYYHFLAYKVSFILDKL